MTWPMVKFKDVISDTGVFSDGDWVESKDQDPDGGVRLIQLADIGVARFIDKSSRFLTMEKAKELRCTFLEGGDILIARMPDPIGRACIFPENMGDCVTVVDVCVVRPESDKVNTRWLMHLINSDSFKNQISQHVTGTTRQRISRGNLAKLEIPLPPLAEQKRIAAILDKADAIRCKRQQAIQLADDFLRAVFLEMFGDPVTNPKGWEVVELKDLIDPKDKLNYGVVQPGDHDESGVPLIRSGDLSDNTPEVTDLRRVSEKIDLKHKKSRLVGNEILIACVGSIGRVGWVSKDMVGWNIARAVTRIPLKGGVNREYVYRYLQSPFVQGYFERETRAVAQPTLNVGLIAKTPIALPPSKLQNEFLIRYSKIKAYRERLTDKLLDQESLISSLSQKAFRGEL